MRSVIIASRFRSRCFSLAMIALLSLGARGRAATNQAQPAPRSAVPIIFSAFDRVPVVALGGALHGRQDVDDFARELIRDPRFSVTVRNIVIEFGNSLYQPVLDRYIAGGVVPMQQLELVWRNTTQPFAGRAEQKSFIVFVRELNRRLPPDRRIRVLAGDPPIDWAKIRTAAEVKSFFRQRDSNFAAVVEEQVLAKHQKALLLVGDFHVVRHSSVGARVPTVTMLLESKYPHSTYVIIPHNGFGNRNGELEPRLAKWPTPSIAMLRGTWLGSLAAFTVYNDNVLVSNPSKIVDPFPGLHLQELADAYLYLGPAASIPEVNLPEDTDAAYAHELARRQRLLGGGPRRVVPVPTPAR